MESIWKIPGSVKTSHSQLLVTDLILLHLYKYTLHVPVHLILDIEVVPVLPSIPLLSSHLASTYPLALDFNSYTELLHDPIIANTELSSTSLH